MHPSWFALQKYDLGGLNCRYPLFPVPSPLGWALSVSPQAEIWNRTRDLVFKLPQNKVFRGVLGVPISKKSVRFGYIFVR